MKKRMILIILLLLMQVGFSKSKILSLNCMYFLYEIRDNKVFYVEGRKQSKINDIELEIEGADYKTFKMLDTGGVARDKKIFIIEEKG